MPLFLVDELLEYKIGDAVFLYERLRRQDANRIRYLCSVRGSFDDDTFQQVSLAVSIKGWRNLAGQQGEIGYPLAKAADAITSIPPEQVDALIALYPGLSEQEREHLHGRLYVVERLPMDVFLDFYPRVRELEPEDLKKRWLGSLNGASSLPTGAPDTSSPALTVVTTTMDSTASAPPATVEDSAPAPGGN